MTAATPHQSTQNALLEHEAEHLAKMVRYKKRSRILFYLLQPYFLIRALFVWLLYGLSYRAFKTRAASFLRRYFTRFFKFKGVNAYFPDGPVEVNEKRPFIVLGARYHGFSSLYALTLFNHSIIVPLPAFFERFRVFSWSKVSLMGRFFKCIRYSDAPLKGNLDNVKQLLSAGYPVYVHINHGLLDDLNNPYLDVHKALGELMDLGVPVYCLRLDGFENYKHSNLFRPILLRVRFVNASTLFSKDSDTPLKERLAKIVQFFGFRYFNLVE